jgi:uncharacterized protein YlxW (UPF0749 family)
MAVSAADNHIEGPFGSGEPAGSVAPASDHGWVWQVSALSAVLGVMLALAVTTAHRIRTSNAPTNRLGVSSAFLARYRDQNQRLQDQILELRGEVNEYMGRAGMDSRAAVTLKKQWDALRQNAGLAAAEGAGLKITVRDSTDVDVKGTLGDYPEFMVHDQDLNNIIWELKSSGAQHLAISGADPTNLQRVIVRTTARCVGPTAIVNGTPLSAPYHILAIGDAARMRAALERSDGWVRTRRLDERKMIVIEDADRISLPEYSGTLSPRYARPAGGDA